MSKQPPAHVSWSYSRLEKFESCPKMVWHTAISPKWSPDRVPYESSPAAEAGKAVDTALTTAIDQKVALPAAWSKVQPWLDLARALPGHKFTQLQVALDPAFALCSPTAWDTVWVRAAYDFAAVNKRHATILDWKNGMIRPETRQLKLYAALGFILWPEVDYISTSYVWLQKNATTDEDFERDQADELWQEFTPTVERMQLAYATNTWAATPKKEQWGWNCRRCPANQHKKCSAAKVPYEPFK